MAVDLDTRLRTVVGAAAAKLEKARGFTTVRDLLDFLPRTYLDPARPAAFRDLPQGEDVVVVGTVRSATTRQMKSRRGRLLVVDVEDEAGGGTLQLTFFKPFGHQDRLVPGARVVCSGQITTYGRQLQLTHPDYAVLNDPTGSSSGGWLLGGLVPVYPATPKVSPIVHGDLLDLVLHAIVDLPDPLPEEVRREHDLPDLLEAYRMAHRPQTEAEARRGRWRLKFQEAFVVQAALARARLASDAVPAVPREPVEGGLLDALLERLSFELTAGQQEVLAELRADLARPVPMHRLLQGEVGSGKTVLALLAMLAVVDGGAQAALLAPTEVLAAQHHRAICAMLGPLAEGGLLGGADNGTRVALLTGSQSAAERRTNLLAAASGEAGIVVGTHALIQEHVQLADLGLVVVDEQHRFGVEQRNALRDKAGTAPHVLVMTATPIPRTVAMTVYGDMTTSTLRELPRGRQPISTHVVTADRPGWLQRTWERVAEEVRGGGQVYVVCPRIGEEDDPDLPGADTVGPGGPTDVRPPVAPQGEEADDLLSSAVDPDPDAEEVGSAAGPSLHGVHQVVRALRALPSTRDLRIEALHGRMSGDEKDDVMRRFAAGEVDLLVATTVIEVGVDVADATTMVVLDADRFGISQLHQLRGRVGRGGRPGLCLLVTQGGSGDEGAVTRLDHVASTTDGFELARLDLETRREGDVLGASQSGGRSGLRFLRLARDEELIVTAHAAAWSAVEADPDLTGNPALRRELDQLDAERAAFLERG
ncbi:ATP-dependent DNA helicase RecG [Ornithinimicrobium humiphilum]|uniref:ATP-dependent DNA helicase RecG n=1 Tax=Ornithinimicrobium humiphilum TaxID=125288 RepID=A0A543KQC2_9MICO|nr:ATP-dependent DNA helicase RecG [Ornithinimicrobium humiphilum]TQM97280.1 ATP-dependent DNA helicase RecG [Ornithinimicrobium humiphilum]